MRHSALLHRNTKDWTLTLFASLPWYDFPQSENNLNNLWTDLYTNLSAAYPVAINPQLNRSTQINAQWSNPNLILSQCCGPDLFTEDAAALSPIARPVFRDLDCSAGYYFSYIVRKKNTHTIMPRIAINALSSQSGCYAALEWFNYDKKDCDRFIISGSHANSLDLIRQNKADYAAIDAHSWTLLNQQDIEIIGKSSEALTPPFVRHRDNPVTESDLFNALKEAVAKLGKPINIESIIAADSQMYHSFKGFQYIDTLTQQSTVTT